MSSSLIGKHRRVNGDSGDYAAPIDDLAAGDATTTPADDEQEKAHFQRIVNAFKSYRSYSLQKIAQKERFVSSLPESHRRLLGDYRQHLDAMRTCVQQNSEIIKLIVNDVENMFENVRHEGSCGRGGPGENGDMNAAGGGGAAMPQSALPPQLKPTLGDLDKVQVTLKQLVRDWSSDGADERKTCYLPIIEHIEKEFPPDKVTPGDITILIPGAGLGRLAFEIAKRGYSCQGNEFSLFMLFASNFILNRCKGINCFKVHPFAHNVANNISHDDQLRMVTFPDVDPSDMPHDSLFSMAAGDFLEVYTSDDSWHCVGTCFFIDCANNIVAFLETIYRILKPGGVWINLGPLLYHFADMPGEDSIEPSFELLRKMIVGLGFQIEKEQFLETTYTQNPRSMFQYHYNSVLLVCRKPTCPLSSPNSTSYAVAGGSGDSTPYGSPDQVPPSGEQRRYN